MSLATVVVTRASANVLAELAYLGKPVIAMPLPSAAADHQTANAEILAAKGAAILLSQETTTVTVLIDQLRRLLADDRQRQQLGQSIRAFSSPEAPKLIAELIIKTAQNRVS